MIAYKTNKCLFLTILFVFLAVILSTDGHTAPGKPLPTPPTPMEQAFKRVKGDDSLKTSTACVSAAQEETAMPLTAAYLLRAVELDYPPLQARIILNEKLGPTPHEATYKVKQEFEKLLKTISPKTAAAYAPIPEPYYDLKASGLLGVFGFTWGSGRGSKNREYDDFMADLSDGNSYKNLFGAPLLSTSAPSGAAERATSYKLTYQSLRHARLTRIFAQCLGIIDSNGKLLKHSGPFILSPQKQESLYEVLSYALTSGFLKIHPDVDIWTDSKDNLYINYQYNPTTMMSEVLAHTKRPLHASSHTLTLGCGRFLDTTTTKAVGIKELPGGESFPRLCTTMDFHSQDITIDQTIFADPHILWDMTDPAFLQSIPAQAFQAVRDHTFNHVCEAHAQLLPEIARVLKPQGTFNIWRRGDTIEDPKPSYTPHTLNPEWIEKTPPVTWQPISVLNIEDIYERPKA